MNFVKCGSLDIGNSKAISNFNWKDNYTTVILIIIARGNSSFDVSAAIATIPLTQLEIYSGIVSLQLYVTSIIPEHFQMVYTLEHSTPRFNYSTAR